MLLIKGDIVFEVKDEIQRAAFLKAGYEEVGSRKEVETASKKEKNKGGD